MADSGVPVDLNVAEATWLAAESELLTNKQDATGREATRAQSQTVATKHWGNFVDNVMNFVQKFFTRTTFDNRTAEGGTAVLTGIATSGGGTSDFEVDVACAQGQIVWLKLRSLSGPTSVGGKLEFFNNSLRTVKVVDIDIEAGNPPVASDTVIVGFAIALIADTGANLPDRKLYGRVTNDGATDSDYALEMVVQGRL